MLAYFRLTRFLKFTFDREIVKKKTEEFKLNQHSFLPSWHLLVPPITRKQKKRRPRLVCLLAGGVNATISRCLHSPKPPEENCTTVAGLLTHILKSVHALFLEFEINFEQMCIIFCESWTKVRWAPESVTFFSRSYQHNNLNKNLSFPVPFVLFQCLKLRDPDPDHLVLVSQRSFTPTFVQNGNNCSQLIWKSELKYVPKCWH